jgi:SAM-dependent methyltransferase
VVERPVWAPSSIDLDRPSVARMYDHYLGGSHNFEVDRRAAEAVSRIYPGMAAAARANRSFLRRAVHHLAEQGIEQFLDLGSGIPTVGSVHEVARAVNPACRVAYVDVEPVAVAHSTALLADEPGTVAVQGDLRSPDTVLADPEVRELLDFSQPIGVLLVAVLHFVAESDAPRDLVDAYLSAVVPGSHLVISHASLDGIALDEVPGAEAVRQIYRRTDSPLVVRSRAEIAELFTGLELAPPGVVPLSEWRPDSDDPPISAFVGVGRKV